MKPRDLAYDQLLVLASFDRWKCFDFAIWCAEQAEQFALAQWRHRFKALIVRVRQVRGAESIGYDHIDRLNTFTRMATETAALTSGVETFHAAFIIRTALYLGVSSPNPEKIAIDALRAFDHAASAGVGLNKMAEKIGQMVKETRTAA